MGRERTAAPYRGEESGAVVAIIKGDTVQSTIWPEPVEVALVEEIDGGAYVRIVGQLRQSRGHVDQFLSRDEAAQLQSTRDSDLFTAAPRDVFLAVETRRYRFAALYDPLLAMNTSEVDPLPHQIEAVYGYVLKLPRIRFLIADDPGAGKTIMAGLIIKELKLRHLVKRILIVAPGHLKDQWRRELKERFEENFTVADRGVMDALYGENIWARELQIITSLDFAKQDDVIASLAAVHFDLVVVDEAHKMAAYRYGAKLDKTSRYRLGEALSEHSTHLLFLTATPHRGDPENFRLFLDLLEPGFFATPEMLEESIRNQDNPLFIRRIKEDLRDFEGRPLFLPRHVETRAYALGVESPAEKTLYNDLSRYVNGQYNRALQRDRRRNVAFALVILQRRLASSTYALLRSLERRQKRLRDLLQGPPAPRQPADTFEFDAVEEWSEEERWRQEELWETLSVAENRQELEREIATLDALIAKAKAVISNDGEIKLRHLRRALEELDRSDPGVRMLIFTESRDTLDYLERRLRAWGYRLCTIHGGMRLEERIAAEGTFRRGEAQIMIATEAAGEGINLQVCHLMVNYDLPWNPNRLEQRMGRIHRYGQTKEVSIFNLVASDTREGQVLTRLFAKLEEIKAALGNDKVFDVIGEVLEGRDLADLLLQAAASARDIDEILRELEVRVDHGYVARVRENLGESLATRYIDYTRIRELADQAREHRLIPEYTEAFFKRAVDAAGGRWHERRGVRATGAKVSAGATDDRRDGETDAVPADTGSSITPSRFLMVESLPFAVRQIGDDGEFQRQHGLLARRYPLITFDKEVAFRTPEAEFVSFGHPLFEALLRWVERTLDPALGQGAVFTDPDGRLDGVLLFYESEVRDGLGAIAGSRLFALMYDLASAEMRPADAAILWDLQEGGDMSSDPSFGLDEVKRRAWGALLPELESYRRDLSQERHRQGMIKEKYGVKSLEHLVVKLDGDLIALYARQAEGESVDLPIRNKEEQKRGYERALLDLQESSAREQTLTLATPRFVAAVRVVPAVVVADGLASDPEVERIGMEVTTRHERGQGRTPEDVSKQNLGFDIRSTDAEGQKRYIEVKARAGVGSVLLTQNEWFKAQRFRKDYYLYVVLNAASTPELHTIRDPAAILRPEEQVEVRYLVSVGDILAHGEPE